MDEPTTATGPIREVVRNTGSSKKADVAPPSADPAKAKKKSTKTTGNDNAAKTKNNNNSVAGPSSTASSRPKKSFDRHSKSGKTDSAKKFKQGWGNGDDSRALVEEEAAADDAKAELDAEASEPKVAAKSLADYFAEQASTSGQFAAKATRAANQGAEEKWSNAETIEKPQEQYIAGSSSKKLRSKQLKEKKFLDFEATFSDSAKPSFDNKKPFKGSKGGRKPNASSKPQKPTVNDANFPSL